MNTTTTRATLAFALLMAGGAAQAAGVVVGRLTTSITDLQLNAGAQAPSISPDGRYVAFVSSSSNMGPPANGSLNVYRYDLFTDEYLLATAGLGIGNSYAPSISVDGLRLAFESLANNLAAGNPSGLNDLFYSEAFSVGQGEIAYNTYLVSKGMGGAVPNGESRYASISASGRWVAFYSDASNLIASDTNAAPDIFVADADTLFSGAPERISVDSNEAQINGPSRALSPNAISSDGRYVAFAVDTPVSIDGSNAGTLEDVFIRDRTAGTTSLISKSTAGVAGNSSSDSAAISPNARYVVFRSFSTNLVASASGSRIFVRDRQTSSTSNMPLPVGAASCEDPRIADTGDITSQCNMNQGNQQAYLYRPAGGGVFYRLSTSLTAANGNNTSGNYTGISADGNFTVFDSSASDLVAGDSNALADVFYGIDFDVLDRIFADGYE
jgi:Tol biopolymer transport system component